MCVCVCRDNDTGSRCEEATDSEDSDQVYRPASMRSRWLQTVPVLNVDMVPRKDSRKRGVFKIFTRPLSVCWLCANTAGSHDALIYAGKTGLCLTNKVKQHQTRTGQCVYIGYVNHQNEMQHFKNLVALFLALIINAKINKNNIHILITILSEFFLDAEGGFGVS